MLDEQKYVQATYITQNDQATNMIFNKKDDTLWDKILAFECNNEQIIIKQQPPDNNNNSVNQTSTTSQSDVIYEFQQ